MEELREELVYLQGVEDIDETEEIGSSGYRDVLTLFGREKLEGIQRALSKTTRLGFVTVDYRGEPITEETSFSRFCQTVRKDRIRCMRCKMSDAFGASQAAVMHKPCVYFCPCGFLEVAIPIVINGQFLGGFIGGQIRCTDAPDSVSRLSKILPLGDGVEEIEDAKEMIDEMVEYPFEKFMDIANMVFMVVGLLGENQISLHERDRVYFSEKKQLKKKNEKLRKDLKQREAQIMDLEASLEMSSVLEMMNSLMNLTVIEDAPRTAQMLKVFIDYTKYSMAKKGTFVRMKNAVDQIDRYLELQKMRFGEKFDYEIHITKRLDMQRVPAGVLLPFVKEIANGVALQKGSGKVMIRGDVDDGICHVAICDTGKSLTDAELKNYSDGFRELGGRGAVLSGIENARIKLKNIFGDQFSITESRGDKGNRFFEIRWPELFGEGK